MIILNYKKTGHKEIIYACVHALKQGKVVAYPTDTSYGLAADASNLKAIKRLYKIKERNFNKPVHVVVPFGVYAKKIVKWNSAAGKLAGKFWPGALTLVLPLKSPPAGSFHGNLNLLSAKTGFLGLRMPANRIAADLSVFLKKPITATSANPSADLSGGYDSYSAEDIIAQFGKRKHKPDIIINAGKLPRRKPSTVVKIFGGKAEILRPGPVSRAAIEKVLNKT